MPLQTIPVLEQDYPVFDWAQFQSSRDALVKDGYVIDFKKEAWNAIVDKLNDILKEAGMEWDNAYTTILGASVREAYGALEAEMFNSVRYNIDQAAPIGWRWANDPTFRGYVGREDFRGVSWYGNKADSVYPEYIIELVRKLNLLIDIMKDNANTTDAAHQSNSSTLFLQGLIRKPSAPMAHESESATILLPGLVHKPSKPIAGEGKSASLFLQGLIRKPSKPMSPEKYEFGTLYESAMVQKPVKVLDGYSELMHTLFAGDMDVWKSLRITPGIGMAESSGAAQIVDLPPSPMVYGGLHKSLYESEAAAVESKPMDGCADLGKTIHKGEILPREPFGVAGADKSTTKHSATPDGLIPLGGGGTGKAESASMAQIDSAWIPPIWVGDALLIMQTHEATLNGNELGVM